MTPEIHCSACDALVGNGCKFCPGCGLPLTAEARPAVYAYTTRWPWSLVILGVVAIMLGIMWLGSQFAH